MPPYRYDAPEPNRYAATIGDILREQGLIAARRAEQVGQIQARAAEQSGHAWAGAVSTIGQTAGQIPQQLQRQQRVAQQDEAAALQLGEQKRAIASRDAFAKIIAATPQLDEDGVSLYDVAAIGKQLAAAGVDPGDAVKHLGGINEAFRAEKAAKIALVKRGAEGVIAAGNDPTLAGHFLDQLEKNGTYTPAQVGQFREFIAADPTTNVAKLTAMLVGKRELMSVAPGGTVIDKGTGTTVLTVPDPKGDATTARLEAAQQETARHNQALEDAAQLTAGRAEATAAETARHNKAMESLGAQRNATAAAGKADVTELSPEGLDAAALNYAKTGTLPPLGMGDKNTRKQIINRAAAMMPGLDVASAKADFAANSASLTALQKQRDAIGAFEQTAKKNIDVFLATAGKVVDTGSPLANGVARYISGKALGSPDQAAYEAARQVAINEIAKITSNPTLSGTLSDSARHEVDAFNPQTATLKQTVAVMRLLKQDMDNRTSALDEQLSGIKTRIGKASDSPKADALTEGTEGSVNGRAAVWKTVNGVTGWYAK